MGEYDEQLVFEMGYDKGFKDGIKGSIPKDQYEVRLKADMVAMLTDIQLEFEACVDGGEGSPQFEQGVDISRCQVVDIIQQKINAMRKINHE